MKQTIEEQARAPIDERLTAQQRRESGIALSELVTRMATVIICRTLVEQEELMQQERFAYASAFLQRVTSTHLCNHKLTKEGIALTFRGETFPLHEAFRTMTLSRSVYEHLVMFFFLYTHPRTDEQRTVAWDYWKITSMKDLLDYDADGHVVPTDISAQTCADIEALRRDIFFTRTGMECSKKLDEWTAIGKPTQNGCLAFFRRQEATDVRRVSYNQAWRYLFGKDQDEMAQLYRLLSIHCHPIFTGLTQYQDQAQRDEGTDIVPLYLSSCFLACLCRLFLRLVPGGQLLFDDDFTTGERQLFRQLSLLRITEDGK